MKKNRTVFCFWENKFSTRMPDYLELCIESTKRNCTGDIEFQLVTPDNLYEFISKEILPAGFEELCPAHKSDYIRVKLLCEYGGAWFDADTITFQPIEENLIGYLKDNELVSFVDFSQAVFASRANGEFISAALESIERVIHDTPKKGSLGWSSIGADILYPLAKEKPRYQINKRCVFGGWRHWEKFLQPGHEPTDNMLCCFLYNKFMFPVLKDKTRKEILESDTLLANLLKIALNK